MENAKPAAVEAADRKIWIEPAVRSLDIGETSATPGRGADARGNPFIDSQSS